MSPILDALTGNVLGTSFSELRDSSFSSALNAYESWASELGVSSTASVSPLANTDDDAAVFTLGFNPFKDGTVLKGFHSSEGGIGLYYQQDPGSASTTSGAISATSPNVPLSRFYTGYARMPALLIATRLGTIDNRSENSRWQQTSDTAIFYSTYRLWNGSSGAVHVAIKITKENKITVVCSNVNTANTYLQFMTFNESLTTRTATSAHGGASFLLSLNTAQEIDLHLAAQVFSFNSELNLTPTLNSAFYLQATKSIQLITGSSLSRFVFGWVGDTALFNEPLPIEQISLTFDQLGRPLVFYRVGEDTLKLYWYDPVLRENVLTNFGIGKDPTACFDFPQDTGQSFADVLLFYVRDDQVFMRIQRDRYAIEYPCPAIQPGLKINSAGLRVDNRLQVVYQFKDTGYVPPVPVPPVVVPGRFYYLQSYISAIHTASPLITNRYNWRAGFSMRGYDASSTGIKAVLSQGTNNMPLSFAPAVRAASSLLVVYFRSQVGVNGTFVVRINGREHFFVSSEPLQDGVYKLTAAGNSFSIARNGNVIAAGNLMPAPNANDNGPLAFGSNVHLFNNNIVPGPGYSAIEGYIYNAWLDAGETRYDWPLLDKGEPLQPSVPPGQPITLNQHRPENWRFIKD